MAADSALTIVVVSHTHWDREWYHPAGRFRQRLVDLIDGLLDRGSKSGGTFLLDGQAIVLEDYLAVRPERRAELAALLRSGALEAGPWYVLADELIPSGEALVRNLLAGRRSLRALRADPPPVLYCPDSFGHAAALPILAAGFGFAVAIAWRGYGSRRWPPGDSARWTAADGSAVLLYHLSRDGYELGATLPADRDRAVGRWAEIAAQLAPRATTGVALLLNGADHHAPQNDLAAALDALARVASPSSLARGSLREFAAELVRRSRSVELPGVQGELRDSYGVTWTLQGTLATRAHQKRRNARLERVLLREAEPWSALARWSAGARSQAHFAHAAWRTLLECHPHDTLCGCSTDDVARAMDARMADAEAQAVGIRDDAMRAVLRHDSAAARDHPDSWRSVLVVRNPAARPRGGVADVELVTWLGHEPVGPRSAGRVPAEPRARVATPVVDGLTVQVLDRVRRRDRIESPQHYPDNDAVEAVSAVAWVPSVAAYGTTSFLLRSGRRRGAVSGPRNPVRVTARSLDNGRVRLDVQAGGAIHVGWGDPGIDIPIFLSLEDVGDRGDLYTHSPTGDAVRVDACERVLVRHRGPLRGTLETRWRLPRAPGQSALVVTVMLSVDADSPVVRVTVAGVNTRTDHRLRVRVATGLSDAGTAVFADAALGPVRREAIHVSADDAAMERPPGTAPLHRYVSRFGARYGVTLISDGLAEYEALGPDGDFAVTLVRAVGELSRADLPERPGHAGWPVPTPEAQCLHAFEGRFAILPHGARSRGTVDAIERAADDFLLPLTGATLREALALPVHTVGAELVGEGLALSAIKESEDGAWLVLRCINLANDRVAGLWRLGAPVLEGRYARLDETPLGECAVSGTEISFDAGPCAVVTLLVRLSPAGEAGGFAGA